MLLTPPPIPRPRRHQASAAQSGTGRAGRTLRDRQDGSAKGDRSSAWRNTTVLSGSARPCLIQLSTNYGPPEALRHFIRAHHPAGGEAGNSRSPPSADWKIGPTKERRKRRTGAWARELEEEAEALSPQRTLRDPSRWRGGGRMPSPDANPRTRGIPPICRDPAKTSPAIRSEALESPAGITVRKRDDAPHPIAYHDAARVDDLEFQRPIVLRGAERLPELSLCNSWCDAAE